MAERPNPYMIDEENPEWTAEAAAEARSFSEVFPEQFEALRKGSHPPAGQPKLNIGFRLAADVVQGVRATGPGYNARVEKVLREALAKGEV